MKSFIVILVCVLLMLPVTNLSAYMSVDDAADVVQRVVDGKMSPWAIRDKSVKVTPKPILSKRDTKEMVEKRTRADFYEAVSFGKAKVVDLRKFDTPVKSQGSRGWCTSFATIAVIENLGKQHGKTYDLSEIYLWYQYYEYDMYVAADSATKRYMISESDWPYEEEAPVNPNYKKHGLAILKNVREVNSLEEVIKSLDNNKPIIFATETTSYWGSPNKGVIPAKGQNEGGHAIAVVGYYYDPSNTSTGGGFLIFKNSWGDKWGDGGYGYLPFEYCKKYDCYFLGTDGVKIR